MDKKFSLVAALSVLALVGAGCSTTTTTSNPATTGNTNTSADNSDAMVSDNSAALENTNGEPVMMDDTSAPQDKLNGSWTITEATGSFASLNVGTVYTFDGKTGLTTGSGILASKGPIVKITDSGFSVMFEGMTSPSNYAYHFDAANSLIIEPEGSGQVLTLMKK